MTENRAQYNNQFGANEHLFTLISGIDPAKDHHSNISSIKGKLTKPELQVAVAYLKENFTEKYTTQMNVFQIVKNITKEILLTQAVDFVEKTLPPLCLKCEDIYTPVSQDDSAEDDVLCIQCKVTSHRVCYKKNDINIDQGIFFLCQSFLVNIGKTEEKNEEKKEDKVTVEKVDEGDPTDEEEKDGDGWTKKAKKHRKKRPTSSSDDSSDESSADESHKERNKMRRSPQVKKKKTLCPMLVDGNCPHGAAGRDCEFEHKRKCYKFNNFGTIEMHRGCCRFGNECKYLHPTLCKNAVELKTCLNESCQYAHLKYTKRNKPRDDGNHFRSYSNSYNQRQNPNSQRENPNSQRENQNSQNQHAKSFNYSNQPRVEDARYNSNSSRNTFNRNETSWNQNTNTRDDTSLFKQNQSFLEESLQRMQKELLYQMQKQMETQFQQMQAWERYETEYPKPTQRW